MAARITAQQRERFDLLLQDAIESLPPQFQRVIDEVPIIVIDRPDKKLIAELRRDGVIPADAPESDDEALLGLHTGVAITDRSVDTSGELPCHIHVFREGIVDLAGGWETPQAEEDIYEEIRVTLLHEIGHHFGLDEDDLDDLGYA